MSYRRAILTSAGAAMAAILWSVLTHHGQNLALPSDEGTITQFFDQTYSKLADQYLRPENSYSYYLDMMGVKRHDGQGDGEQQTLLDLGCGTGLLLSQAAGRGLITHGMDTSSVAVELARQRSPTSRVEQGFLGKEPIQLGDGAADFVTMVGVLERVVNQSAALREVGRVLSNQGRFLVMVRNVEALEWKLNSLLRLRETNGHQDAKTLRSWNELFHSNRLRVVDIWPDNYVPWLLWRRLYSHKNTSHYQPLHLPPWMLPLTNAYVFVLEHAASPLDPDQSMDGWPRSQRRIGHTMIQNMSIMARHLCLVSLCSIVSSYQGLVRGLPAPPDLPGVDANWDISQSNPSTHDKTVSDYDRTSTSTSTTNSSSSPVSDNTHAKQEDMFRIDSILSETQLSHLQDDLMDDGDAKSGWISVHQRGRRQSMLRPVSMASSRAAAAILALHSDAAWVKVLSSASGRILYPLDPIRFPNAAVLYRYSHKGFNMPHTDSKRIDSTSWVLLIGLHNDCGSCQLSVMDLRTGKYKWFELGAGDAVLFRADRIPHFVPECSCPTGVEQGGVGDDGTGLRHGHRTVLQLEYTETHPFGVRWSFAWSRLLSDFERIFLH